MGAQEYVKSEKERLYGHVDIKVNYSEAALVSFMETYNDKTVEILKSCLETLNIMERELSPEDIILIHEIRSRKKQVLNHLHKIGKLDEEQSQEIY